jgi:hypothetical protein
VSAFGRKPRGPEALDELARLRLGFPVLQGHGMERGEEERSPDVDPPSGAELLGRDGPFLPEIVEPGRARDDDPPGLLAELPHPVAVFRGGHEVEVRELGEGVPEGVVDRPAGELAAVQVGHGDPEREGRHRGGEHLVAVAEDDQEVRPARGERAGEPRHGRAGRERDPLGVVAREGDGNLRRHRELGRDLADRQALVPAQVPAGDEEAQLQGRLRLERPEEGPVDPEIGAGHGHDADRPHSSISQVIGVPARIALRVRRPTS